MKLVSYIQNCIRARVVELRTCRMRLCSQQRALDTTLGVPESKKILRYNIMELKKVWIDFRVAIWESLIGDR